MVIETIFFLPANIMLKKLFYYDKNFLRVKFSKINHRFHAMEVMTSTN